MAALAGPGSAQTQTPAFVAPPRSIADITAILDQEKPDPAKRAKREANANAAPPAVQGEALGGSCPKGQIKRVVGGNHLKVGGSKQNERSRTCVPR